MEEGHEKPLSRINPDELEFLPPEDLSNIE
jgi:hypothetical protein